MTVLMERERSQWTTRGPLFRANLPAKQNDKSGKNSVPEEISREARRLAAGRSAAPHPMIDLRGELFRKDIIRKLPRGSATGVFAGCDLFRIKSLAVSVWNVCPIQRKTRSTPTPSPSAIHVDRILQGNSIGVFPG